MTEARKQPIGLVEFGSSKRNLAGPPSGWGLCSASPAVGLERLPAIWERFGEGLRFTAVGDDGDLGRVIARHDGGWFVAQRFRGSRDTAARAFVGVSEELPLRDLLAIRGTDPWTTTPVGHPPVDTSFDALEQAAKLARADRAGRPLRDESTLRVAAVLVGALLRRGTQPVWFACPDGTRTQAEEALLLVLDLLPAAAIDLDSVATFQRDGMGAFDLELSPNAGVYHSSGTSRALLIGTGSQPRGWALAFVRAVMPYFISEGREGVEDWLGSRTHLGPAELADALESEFDSKGFVAEDPERWYRSLPSQLDYAWLERELGSPGGPSRIIDLATGRPDTWRRVGGPSILMIASTVERESLEGASTSYGELAVQAVQRQLLGEPITALVKDLLSGGPGVDNCVAEALSRCDRIAPDAVAWLLSDNLDTHSLSPQTVKDLLVAVVGERGVEALDIPGVAASTLVTLAQGSIGSVEEIGLAVSDGLLLLDHVGEIDREIRSDPTAGRVWAKVAAQACHADAAGWAAFAALLYEMRGERFLGPELLSQWLLHDPGGGQTAMAVLVDCYLDALRPSDVERELLPMLSQAFLVVPPEPTPDVADDPSALVEDLDGSRAHALLVDDLGGGNGAETEPPRRRLRDRFRRGRRAAESAGDGSPSGSTAPRKRRSPGGEDPRGAPPDHRERTIAGRVRSVFSARWVRGMWRRRGVLGRSLLVVASLLLVGIVVSAIMLLLP